MQSTENQKPTSIRKPKIIQELQPNKICNCGACEPRKPKLPDGKRRLKVSNKLIIHQRAWVKEDSIYDYVPQIKLEGQWLKRSGFEGGQYVVISSENGKLIIEIERD